mmetsp:Transcript_32745/g.75196  ORF Transcript_32745/g.75196 Transcript_32745/m.75196 type:complete len:201 (+) Transcript_32745:1096-1698(+)
MAFRLVLSLERVSCHLLRSCWTRSLIMVSSEVLVSLVFSCLISIFFRCFPTATRTSSSAALRWRSICMSCWVRVLISEFTPRIKGANFSSNSTPMAWSLPARSVPSLRIAAVCIASVAWAALVTSASLAFLAVVVSASSFSRLAFSASILAFSPAYFLSTFLSNCSSQAARVFASAPISVVNLLCSAFRLLSELVPALAS